MLLEEHAQTQSASWVKNQNISQLQSHETHNVIIYKDPYLNIENGGMPGSEPCEKPKKRSNMNW